MKQVKFILNGVEIAADVRLKETLLLFLREKMNFKGTKKGCDCQSCGACTVLINGAARRSCSVLMAHLDGATVQTIEGLTNNGSLHPIQAAFLKSGAVQCGYCTPGMVMATKALLDRNPRPSETEIKTALKRNICRCTGYQKIVQGVKLAADWLSSGVEPEPLLTSGDVGENVIDFEGELKVTGELKFADDYDRAPMLFGKILWSLFPHAKIVKIDLNEAKALPGVKDIITAKDIPGGNSIGFNPVDQPVLAEDRVRWVGEPIALVLAENAEIATEARDKIKVHYEPLPVVSSPEEALLPSAPQLHPTGNIVREYSFQNGEISQALETSALVVTGCFTTPFVEHAYLEPEAVLAEVEADGRVTILTGTQYPFEVKEQVRQILALPEDKVRVVVTPCGGAFGGKTDVHPCIPLAALGAVITLQPVKITLERTESIRSSTKRHASIMDYQVGFDREGHLLGVEASILMDAGPYTGQSDQTIEQATIFASGPYRVPNIKVTGKAVRTNNANGGAFRGFGINQVAFALESLLDEAAEKLGVTPLELRALNVLREGDITPPGEKLRGKVPAMATIDAARLMVSRLDDAKTTTVGWRRGVGVACAYKNVGWGRGAEDNGSASLRLKENGKLQLMASAPDMGQGIRTGLYQIIRSALGVCKSEVEFELIDTSKLAMSNGGSAERLTYCTGNAVWLAATQFKQELLQFVEKHDGLLAANLEGIAGNQLHYKWEKGTKSITLEEIAQKLSQENQVLAVDKVYVAPKSYSLEDRGLVPEDEYRLYPGYSYNTAVAEVEVEEQTSQIRVVEISIFQDVGTAINPEIIEGQLHGSALQALGYALKEKYSMRNSIPESLLFSALNLPKTTDAPQYRTVLIEIPDDHGPLGAKGISEVAMVPICPAIANAVANATGVRSYDLPITVKIKINGG